MKKPPEERRTRTPSRLSSSKVHSFSALHFSSKDFDTLSKTAVVVSNNPSFAFTLYSTSNGISSSSEIKSRRLPLPLEFANRAMIFTAVYVPSSTQPFSRRAQCPEVSIAISLPCNSFALLITLAYPRRYRKCFNPSWRRNAVKPSEVVESVTMVEPGLDELKMTLNKAINLFLLSGSYEEHTPLESIDRGRTNPERSASVSNMIPTSALHSSQARIVSSTISFFSGLGTPILSGNVPSGVRWRDPATFAPSSRNRSLKKEPDPLPGLTTILRFESGLAGLGLGSTSLPMACFKVSL
mmetsp:Transcript_7010/g.10222  ORF Transcript_7010/g.10222 Transcript_7010/m.10222 type:complete len:297 (+) Transcript_7010:196-1086(+)